jgi:hypothetical protein
MSLVVNGTPYAHDMQAIRSITITTKSMDDMATRSERHAQQFHGGIIYFVLK